MKINKILPFLMAALSLGACNSNEPDPGTVQFGDIVTIKSSDNQGTTFTFREDGDSPLVTLTCENKLGESIKVGERIYIIYQPLTTDQHAVSGPVKLIDAGTVLGNGYAPETLEPTADSWTTASFQVSTIWRTGNYLNFALSVPSSITLEDFHFYLDENTANSNFPEYHIVINPSIQIYETYVPTMGSYDISNMWDNADVDGIKVYYDHTNYYTFIKNATVKPL